MNMFKIGDIVRVTDGGISPSYLNGDVGEIVGYCYPNSDGTIGCYYRSNGGIEAKIYSVKFGSYVTSIILNENQIELINKPMNIKEKFAIALLPEPNKSARKIGILDGDNLLTDEGSKIFLSWLYQKNAEDFKKEVIDGLLKEKQGEEKENK